MSLPVPPPNSAPSALQRAVLQLAAGQMLDEADTELVFGEIMGGTADPALIGELLLSLRAHGEPPNVVAGAARALRSAMRRVSHPAPETLVDTCGTGGGGVTTVNISTAAAFVAAGAGATVAKHGNRSFTSRSGSADVLESLGLAIDLQPAAAGDVLREVGVVFLFAPTYHPAMRHVAAVRRQLGVPTIMNMLGPLANPASAGRQVVGVGDPGRAPAMAGALARLGTTHALVLHAELGMDEISPMGRTRVWEIRDSAVREWEFDPGKTGLAATSLAGLEGGEPHENAAKLVALLERPAGAAHALRSAVLLNAAAAIYVAGLAPTLETATELAVDSLESGRAINKLEALRRAAGERPGTSP